MQLFRQERDEPSIVRVGQEGAISSDLRPFHSDRVEASFKDKFRAELRERLEQVGARLGLGAELITRLTFAETTIRPVVDRLQHLTAASGDFAGRAEALCTTLANLCGKVGVNTPESRDWSDDQWYRDVLEQIGRDYDVSPDRIARFLAVAKLSRDWLGSISTRQRSFESFLAGTRRIVAGTCVGLGRSSLGLTQNRFDLVVVDEAARCTASELAVPMQSGRWIVLVGDQLQLEPHHRPDVVMAVERQAQIAKREILKSDFERVFKSKYGKASGQTLLQQYRMLPAIGRVVSQAFYNGQLSHARGEPVIPPSVLPPIVSTPLVWVATDALGAEGFQRPAADSRSLVNESEVDAVMAILRDFDTHEPFHAWLQEQDRFQEPIGIICTYAAQREFIRRRLPASGLTSRLRENCKVDTVDSYQGKQNAIVILSLVRNNSEGTFARDAATIRPGFMDRPNRINVALSRAMDRLVIIGAMDRWMSGTPMHAVSAAFRVEQAAGNARVLNAAAMGAARSSAAEKHVPRRHTGRGRR